jgi:hypothetical protein
MGTADDIGGRGEAICFVRLSDFCGNTQPYFRPHFLGDKFPALDFLVELVNAGRGSPFFFVQVRATRKGFTRKPPVRLKVELSEEDAETLILYPAPTYIVGVDEVNQRAFIIAATANVAGGLPSLPTAYPLDDNNLKILWDEVKAYWQSRDMTHKRSHFSIYSVSQKGS